MAILVHTQYIENYGMDESINHWKFKGGTSYSVTGTDDRPANAMALVAETVHISESDFGFEFPITWEYLPYDDIKTDENGEPFKPLVYVKKRKDFGKVLSTWAGGSE